MFTFLSSRFGYEGKLFNKKANEVNFKTYGFTALTANNYNTHFYCSISPEVKAVR